MAHLIFSALAGRTGLCSTVDKNPAYYAHAQAPKHPRKINPCEGMLCKAVGFALLMDLDFEFACSCCLEVDSSGWQAFYYFIFRA